MSGKFSWKEHLAVFGGAFDPPHLGHQEAIRGLFQNPKVECVMITPSAQTPLKETLTSFKDRFEMSKLFAESLAEFPIEITPIERDEKIQYTWQLLNSLAKDADQPLAFVIGTDQFVQLDKWAKFPHVMGFCDWIILLRKPTTFASLQSKIEEFCKQGWLKPDPSLSTGRRFKISIAGVDRVLEFVDTAAPDVSSTDLRKNLALGKTDAVQPWISESILKYIERNQLYGATRNHDH